LAKNVLKCVLEKLINLSHEKNFLLFNTKFNTTTTFLTQNFDKFKTYP